MNIDLEQQLYNFGPILYQEKDLSMNQTCMCWGFECPDEWFSLLKDLTIKIEEINNKYKGQYEYVAHQVKEKFGSLRFYGEIKILIENPTKAEIEFANKLDDYIFNEILDAEEKSSNITMTHNISSRKL